MPEILERLGDAITGTDRQGATLQGRQARSELDQRRARTQAAMEQAAVRRAQAEREAAELESALSARDALNEPGTTGDPASVPLGDLVMGGQGSDYAGAMQGQLRSQEFGNRRTIADPSVEDPEVRRRSAQAVEPSALAEPPGLGDETVGPLELVETPEGPRYMRREDAVGQAPAARPSAAGGGDGPSLGRGVESADTNAIYRQAAALFGGSIDPATGEFTGLTPETALRAQRVAEEASTRYATGDTTHAGAVSDAFRQLRADPRFGDDPLGDLAAPPTEPPPVAAPGGGEMPQLGPDDRDAYEQLPSGTRFVAPDGQIRIKP